MLVGAPIGETSQVLVGPLVVGVEDVGAIGVHQNARLVVAVVHVAAHMGALLDDEHPLAAALGQFTGHNTAGKAAAHHNGIDLREVYFGVGNKIHSHRFLSAHKRFARRLSRCKGHICPPAILPKFAGR